MNVTIWEWIAGIAGTIFLGALGSGLWDVLFKKWYGFVTRIMLQIITFGYKALRDTLYLEAARGKTDRASLWIVYVVVLFALPQILLSQPFWNGPTSKELFQTIQQAEAAALPHTDGQLSAMSIDQLQALKDRMILAQKAAEDSDRERLVRFKQSASMVAFFERYRWSLIIGWMLTFMSILIRAIRIGFVSTIITDYRQRFAICLPFLTEEERHMIASRYAQMSNREEYSKIMQDLKSVASAQNIRLPITLFS